MARYGESAENFNRETAALEAAMRARKGVAAAEGELSGALDKSSGALDRATAKTRLYRQAKQEADEFAQRSAQVEATSARGIDVETAAIQRNTAARERALAAQRAGGGLAGARDPLFGRAAGLADPITGVSQYELRRQLGIGSARASRLQEAIGSGFRPQGGPLAVGAATRAEAAQASVVAADIDRAAAQRQYTSAVKRGDQAAAQVAAADREAANARLKDARLELQSAAREQAARAANVEAIAQDTANRRRAAGGPGSELIRHPELFGRQAYAPISQPAPVARTPVQEYPLRYGGGSVAYDAQAEGRTASVNRASAAQIQHSALARQAMEEDARLTEIYGQQGQALDRVSQMYRRSGVELGAASQQMTRHGALTSEFITAAFRGQATIKELGNQALITAGKFGAWTLAATAVYGAVRAIGSIGKGAIDAQSGVHQLRRVVNDVNPETASKAFGDLAGQFNVPIKDAADAAYRMGQVFHSQADAITGAKAALFSYQTGEVDVATSTTNLIAIQKGFGLSSTDLLSVFDQINQAQNTFGINIGQTEAGLAKAAGTFKNAGGDLDYLLGLFVAINKATGRSGQEIGTGIARAANQIRKPKSQEELKALGVDVDPNNLQLTIQRAIGRAQKPGADYNRIAAAIFGNQYARLLAPVLRDPSTLGAALKGTSQDVSKGSAQKEQAKIREQTDYQLHELGVTMGRIGEALGRAGAFDAAGGFLKLLNAVLHTALDIVNAFDKLPEPLRNALAILGEMYVLMGLLRRFGVADAVGSRLGFAGSQQRREASLVGRGLEAGSQAARNTYEQVARRAQVSATEALGARRAANLGGEEFQSRLNRGAYVAGSEEHLAAQRAQARLIHQAEIAETRALELQLEENLAREEVVLYERDIARMKKLQAEEGAGAVVADAQRRGYYRPADFNQPSSGGAVPVGAYGYDNRTGQRVPLGPLAQELEAGAPLGRVQRAVAPVSGKLRTLAGDASGLSRLNPLNAAARTAASSLERGAVAISGAGGALKRLGGSFARLATSLGPLDYALLGFIAIESIKSWGESIIDEQNKLLREVEATPRSAAQAKAQQARLAAIAGGRDTGSGLGGYLGHVGQNVNYGAANFADTITGNAFSSNYESAADRDARLKREAELGQEAENLRLGLQNAARRKGPGHAVPLQFLGEITKQMAKENRDRISGVISQREFDKLLAKHATEIGAAYNTGDKGAVARARAQLEDLKRKSAAPGAFGDRYKGLSLKDLQTELEGSAQLASEGTNTGLHFREMAFLYERIRQQLGGQQDTKSLQALLKARKTFYSGVEDAVNAELQTSLREATTQPEKNAAYARAQQQLGSNLTGPAQKQLQEDQRRRREAQRQLHQDRRFLGVPRLGDLGGGVGAGADTGPDKFLQHMRERIRQDNKDIDQLDKQIKRDRGDIAAAKKERRDAQLKLRDDAYQSRQAGRQVELAYEQSLTYDKGAQDAAAIRVAAQGVRDAAATYGQGSDQWKQAMTELNNARKNATDYIIDNANANNALISARASGDPTGRAQALAAITTARNTLNAIKSDPKIQGQDRVNQIKNANAALITAQLAYQQYLVQQADALAAARFTLRESTVDDPVKRAQIELEAARDAIRRAHTPADKLTAQAGYNDKRRALRDARVSAREEDIQFDLDMGKITRDQAISQYQQILKGHNLTKEMRRDIQRRIKQLQADSENAAQGFDLDVGNIKLPTIYDVRRAIGELKGGLNQGSRAQFTNKIDVNVVVTDPKAAGKVYDALDQAMGTTISAGMRQAGLTL